MRPGAALTGALLATLATPATWPLALAAFLLRGGIVLVVLPIVVLPSPVGLGNLLAPTLIAVVLGGLSLEIAAIATLGAIAIVTWILIGGLVAGAMEADSVRLVASTDGAAGSAGGIGASGGADPDQILTARILAARILAARILAHLPTSVALLLGSVRLVNIAYIELTSPDDVTIPIVLRVLLGAPEVAVALLVVWVFGEIAGGLAARRIVLDGMPVTVALRDALRALVRHPLAVAAGFIVPLAGLVMVIVPSTLAATVAWSGVRVAMRSPADLVVGTLAVLFFVSLWIVGLALIGVTAAWRAAVWSVAHGDLWPREADPPTPAGT